MQSLIWFISIAALVAVTSSASIGYLEEPVPRNVLESLVEASNLYSPSELARWKKSIYEAPSLPAPPCPKSYLFSCQPNLAPVPCAPAPAPAYAPAPAPAPAPAYAPAPAPTPAKPSYAGAYSIPVPSYAYPQGIPQQLLMPAYGYNQHLH